MDSIDRIRELCSARGVSIARLERECGFSNGYIRGMKDGKMSAERLKKVADYLGVTAEYLLTGNEEGYYINPDTADMAQKIYENKDLRLLFDVAKDVTPEQLKLLHDLALSWKK